MTGLPWMPLVKAVVQVALHPGELALRLDANAAGILQGAEVHAQVQVPQLVVLRNPAVGLDRNVF